MNTWLIIGIGLMLWVIYDLFSGKVWLHREIYKKYEAVFYWSVWIMWMGIGIIVTITSI